MDPSKSLEGDVSGGPIPHVMNRLILVLGASLLPRAGAAGAAAAAPDVPAEAL